LLAIESGGVAALNTRLQVSVIFNRDAVEAIDDNKRSDNLIEHIVSDEERVASH
jgi:hypothetical protein